MSATVGERLKQERLRRNLTLEQAALTTHIRRAYLEAIEANQRQTLPSPVQARGYLRLYADYLHLPVNAILLAWDGKGPIPEAETPAGSNSKSAAESPPAEASTQPTSASAASPFTIQQPHTLPLPEEPPIPIPVEFEQEGQPRSSIELGSHTIFKEIGQKLGQQRQTLGISLAEVERYTRLRQHYLKAMEEGRIDLMPSPVQARGMLSNYAAFLNLDEEALMLRFAEGLQQRRIERLAPQESRPAQGKKRPARPASTLQRFLTPDLIFGAIVVLAILFFAIRTAMSVSDNISSRPKTTDVPITSLLLTPIQNLTPSATLSPTAAATASPSVASGDLAAGLTQVAGANTTIETVQPSPVGGNTVVPPSAPIGTAAASSAGTPIVGTPTLEPINSDPLQIYLVAHQRAYLRIDIDGQEKFNGRIIPGNAYAFSGAKTIHLLSGNAASVQVYFNQQDLGTLGLAGQVLNLVFTAQGMVTATPLPTPTSTSTPPVTATPKTTGTPTLQTSPKPTNTLSPTFTITPLVP